MAESRMKRDNDEKKQQMVYLNVGGIPFKLLRETIERYPESKLAKMVKEFPTQVSRGNPLYVDWKPRSFNWIIEIYRGGNHRYCKPGMSDEELENELRFFELPSLFALGYKPEDYGYSVYDYD